MAPPRVIRGITKPKPPAPPVMPRPQRKPLRRLDALRREATRHPVEIRHPVTEEDIPPLCEGDSRFCDHDAFDDGAEVEVSNPRLQIHGMAGIIESHCMDGSLVVRLHDDDLCYLLQEDEVI